MRISQPPHRQVKPEASQIFSPHALAGTAEAKQILVTNLSHHYSVQALARKAALYGKTIFELGQELRLGHAKKLILETDPTIQEIAEACGYPEQANFSTA